MGDSVRSSPAERDIEQAIATLKKGATLLKYGRRGRPKFSPFRLSSCMGNRVWSCFSKMVNLYTCLSSCYRNGVPSWSRHERCSGHTVPATSPRAFSGSSHSRLASFPFPSTLLCWSRHRLLVKKPSVVIRSRIKVM